MAQEFNYAFDFLQRAHARPQAIAFRALEAEMSYGALRDRVVSYALHMKQRGIGRGSCVAIEANRMPEGPALALATALLGARWVKLSADIPPELGVTHVLSIVVPKVIPSSNFHVVDASWTADPPGSELLAPIRFDGYAHEDDVAFYAQSSGTTGRPKVIPRTYRRGHKAMTGWYASDLPDVIYTLFPPLALAGFAITINTLVRGGTLVAVGRNIAELQQQGVDFVFASPAQADRLCNVTQIPARRIGRLLAGGATITPTLIGSWLRCFAQIDIAYAAQELGAGGRASFTEVPADPILNYVMDDNVETEILDEQGAPCPPNVSGVVRLRADVMSTGYVGAPEATAEAFRDGWFYPGDIGSLDEQGRLRVVGRVKDQYNIGGAKANGADIDAAAGRAFGVMGAVSFVRPRPGRIDELCVLAVLAPGADAVRVAGEVRRHVELLRGSALSPAAVYFAATLPLSENGKPDREAAMELAKLMPAH